MRKITILFVLCFAVQSVFAVAAKTVEEARVTFHNFSGGPYDVSGHFVTVNNTSHTVGSLTIIAGVLNTPAGSLLIFGGLNIPKNQGSLALWAPGTDMNNPKSSDMIDFVQWGSGGQPFESLAVAAGLWAAGTFVNSGLPITRSNNYGNVGSGEWSSSLNVREYNTEDFVEIGPMPFEDHINLVFTQGHRFTEANLYSVLGKLVEHMDIMQSTASLSLSTHEMANGVYLIELKTSDGNLLIKKLIKR